MDPSEAKRKHQQLAYRVAIRLQPVQRLLKDLLVEHVEAGLVSVGGALSHQEVTRALKRMFTSTQELLAHMTSADEVCSLTFATFDREQSGRVSARLLRVALIALSSDELLLKFKGFLNTLRHDAIDRSALRRLLQEISQILALAKQEQEDFGSVEDAVTSCFNGVSAPTVSRQHVLLWLQSEPHLLLWLPALHRLSISDKVLHNVRCYTCRNPTITGLRFRCQRCLNVHVCLSCFLTGRQRKKHKTLHPLREFHTQPTWKETFSSFARSTRFSLLPRRHTHRDDARRNQSMCEEPKDTQDRFPSSSEEASLLSADSSSSTAANQLASHDDPANPEKSHEDDDDDDDDDKAAENQALLSDVRALQRDRSLLEAELQELRLSIQTEQRMLGNQYTEMEVAIETLRHDNVLLSQALNEVKERQTTSPTILLGTPSPEFQEEHSMIGQETPEEVEFQEEYNSESEDDWVSNEEAELQETVDKLKMEMRTDGWTQTGLQEVDLVKASDQVSLAIGHLVTAVRQSRCKALFKTT